MEAVLVVLLQMQQGSGQVEVVWDTTEPYQSVVDCSAANVR